MERSKIWYVFKRFSFIVLVILCLYATYRIIFFEYVGEGRLFDYDFCINY